MRRKLIRQELLEDEGIKGDLVKVPAAPPVGVVGGGTTSQAEVCPARAGGGLVAVLHHPPRS